MLAVVAAGRAVRAAEAAGVGLYFRSVKAAQCKRHLTARVAMDARAVELERVLGRHGPVGGEYPALLGVRRDR